MERDLGPNPLSVEQAPLEAAYVKYIADSTFGAKRKDDELLAPTNAEYYQQATDSVDEMREVAGDQSVDKVIEAFNNRYELIDRELGRDVADQYEKALIEYSVQLGKQANKDLQKIINDVVDWLTFEKANRQATTNPLDQTVSASEVTDDIYNKALIENATIDIIDRVNKLQLELFANVTSDSIIVDAFDGHQEFLCSVTSEYSQIEAHELAFYWIAQMNKSVTGLMGK